jgi:signal transduction histidine kinase
MVRAEAPGTDSQWRASLLSLLPPFLTTVVAAVGVYAVSGRVLTEVAWYGVTAVAAVVFMAAEAVRRGRIANRLRERLAEERAAHERTVNAHIAETRRMTEEVLPSSAAGLRELRGADGGMIDVSDSPDIHPEFREAHRRLVTMTLDLIASEQDVHDARQFSFVDIARRIQTVVRAQAVDLRDMEDRHGMDSGVFGDLLTLDHGNALIGRLADTISVLGGCRPGRHGERPVPLHSVLLGGISRILHYRRVRRHAVPDLGISGSVVEPVIHVLAELLDNACRYSPPPSRVHLTAVEVHKGLAIEIEDGGTGLTASARERWEAVIRQQDEEAASGGTGAAPSLGFSVVGRLCAMYGFQVALRDSAYGGVRAVVIVPSEYLTPASEKSWARGIGAAAGPRDADIVPRSVAEGSGAGHAGSPGTPPRKPGLAAAPAVPAQGPAPARAALGGPLLPGSSARTGNDGYLVTEWTDAGLPQRRRKPDGQQPRARRQAGGGVQAAAGERVRQPADGVEKTTWRPPGGEWLDNFLRDVQEDRRKQTEQEQEEQTEQEQEEQTEQEQEEQTEQEQEQEEKHSHKEDREERQRQQGSAYRAGAAQPARQQGEGKGHGSSDDEFSDEGGKK